MAGKIIADQIEHSTAGSLSTEYVVNGSAKAWVNFNGSGTVAIRDDLNLASLTDNGTGDYTLNFSNSMGNANYSVVCGGILNRQVSTSRLEGTNVRTTTQCQVYSSNSGTLTDFPFMEFASHGDLA
jgi:hypothetical protein